MILYHGSNQIIEQIELSKGRKGKDFGQGFYLSDSFEQAKLMAENTVARMECGESCITKFEFDDNLLHSPVDVKVKLFTEYNIEWARFIIANRNNRSTSAIHNYDIVYGPIADDRVGLQLQRYRQQYISLEQLVEELKYKRPTFQYFFGTEKAICHLIMKG